jgi:hypothetical protein
MKGFSGERQFSRISLNYRYDRTEGANYQGSERGKWMHVFEKANTVLFVVVIRTFGQQ